VRHTRQRPTGAGHHSMSTPLCLHKPLVCLSASVKMGSCTQVGLLAMQMPGVGLDVLGAESEGQIGCAAA
jgi:hypothetical protein